MRHQNHSLRALQLELEKLEIEAEQAPILRQQQHDDSLLDQTLRSMNFHRGRSNSITSSNNNTEPQQQQNTMTSPLKNDIFFPASKLMNNTTTKTSFSPKQQQSTSSLSATPSFNNINDRPGSASSSNNRQFDGSKNNNTNKKTRSSSASSFPNQQKQSFEDAMKIQAAAQLRRVQLTNEFIEYNGTNNQNNSNYDAFAIQGRESSSNSLVSNNNHYPPPVHSVSQKRRFEQTPPDLNPASGDFINILGVQNSPPQKRQHGVVNNNNNTNVSPESAASQNFSPNQNHLSVGGGVGGLRSNNNASFSQHHQPPRAPSFATTAGAASTNNNNNQTTSDSQHHETTAQGKAQAKRFQSWNNDTNFLQSTLSEIETTNATMTLREYRRTKPRVIPGSINSSNAVVNQVTRPASAPINNNNTNTNTDEQLPDNKALVPTSSKTPSRGTATTYNHNNDNNQQMEDEREALLTVLDEATDDQIFQGPSLTRYNDPVLEVKANKRLAELMAREAKERHEKSLRHLGAEKLEEMLIIDEETVAQQKRAVATANAAKRRSLQERLQRQTSAINSKNTNNNNYNNSADDTSGANSLASASGLVPPRVIGSSAQENLHGDVVRELALKEHISLSDIAIKIADDAFEKEDLERRKKEEENAEKEVKRLSAMKRTAATAATNAAEAVLLVKHQAKLENTRQTIRSELDRCKFLVEELKHQSDKAQGTKKKLNRIFAETVQKIGRGFLDRRMVGNFAVKMREQKTLSPGKRNPQRPLVAPKELDGIISNNNNEEVASPPSSSSLLKVETSGDHNNNMQMRITVSNEHSDLLLSPQETTETKMMSLSTKSASKDDEEENDEGQIVAGDHLDRSDNIKAEANDEETQHHTTTTTFVAPSSSPLLMAITDARKDYLACGQDKAFVSSSASSSSVARDHQTTRGGGAGGNHNEGTGSPSSPTVAPLLKRANTAVWSNLNKEGTTDDHGSSPLQQQSAVKDSLDEDAFLRKKSDAELKELLRQRQSLQKLVISGSLASNRQQLIMNNHQNSGLVSIRGGLISSPSSSPTNTNTNNESNPNSNQVSPLILFGNTLDTTITSALEGTTSNTTTRSGSNNNNNNNSSVSAAVQQNEQRQQQQEQDEKQFLESLVVTQDKIIALLTERQAASVKTLRMLQDSKYKSRKAIRSAILIQSLARMYIARCKFIQILEDREFVELSHEAALMIQRVWRGTRARILYRRRQRLRQRFFQNQLLLLQRKSQDGTKADGDVSQTSMMTNFSLIKNAAAAAIQSIWMCFTARRVLHRLRTARSEQDAMTIKTDAAFALTSFMRRILYRRKLEQAFRDKMMQHLTSGISQQEREVEANFAAQLIVRVWQTRVQSQKFQRLRVLRRIQLRQRSDVIFQQQQRRRSQGGSVCDDENDVSLAYERQKEQEQEYAAKKIQNFLINNTTRKASMFVIRNGTRNGTESNLPLNFLNSVPTRNWQLIARLMERKMEIARVKMFVADFVDRLLKAAVKGEEFVF